MAKKITTFLLILAISLMSIVASASTEDYNGVEGDFSGLTEEQIKIIESHQKELRNILKEQGYDLESEEAKEVLEKGLENDIFSFRLLNEGVSNDEIGLMDENEGINSPGAVWYTPANLSNKPYVGHIGVIANNTAYTYEAFPDTGVARFHNNWNSSSRGYGSVYLLGVRGATTTNYKNAATFAQNQDGKGYNWEFTVRWLNTRYYCSQLAWRAWDEQGYNFDGKTNGVIYPGDIYRSNLTYVILQREL